MYVFPPGGCADVGAANLLIQLHFTTRRGKRDHEQRLNILFYYPLQSGETDDQRASKREREREM